MLTKEELKRKYLELSGEEPPSHTEEQLANDVILLYEKAWSKRDKEIQEFMVEHEKLKKDKEEEIQLLKRKLERIVSFNDDRSSNEVIVSPCGVCGKPIHSPPVSAGSHEGAELGERTVCDTCHRLERLQLTALDQISHQLDIKNQLDGIQSLLVTLTRSENADEDEISASSDLGGSNSEADEETIQVSPRRHTGGIKRKIPNDFDSMETESMKKYQIDSIPVVTSVYISPDPSVDAAMLTTSTVPQSSFQSEAQPVLSKDQWEGVVYDEDNVMEERETDKPLEQQENAVDLMLKKYVENRPKTRTIKGFAYHTLFTRQLLQATCPYCPNKCFRNPKGFEDHLIKKHNGRSLPLHKALPVELQTCILQSQNQ